ncbi:MAG: 6-carboxytetrahydropterin synthase QueD [Desulfobacterales bacterium]|nr:MAG: 6-carboxytetrahydropterin synthase QueD [Desulfobacterales bacterium]
MYQLTVLTEFAAAHQLRLAGRKCENLHGHNWKVEVQVEGEDLDEAGVLMDFGVIKQHVRELMKILDHTFLNENPALGTDLPPSSENIARWIGTRMEERLAGEPVRLRRVKAWESDDACAAWLP